MDNFSPSDYWKGIVLYGLNAATYKMALAKCLLYQSSQLLTLMAGFHELAGVILLTT